MSPIALDATVLVTLPAGTELYDAPRLIFDACDKAGIKVRHDVPALMRVLSYGTGEAIAGREICDRVVVHVATG